ncbi:hypothetical protein [Glycomyces terrestris]|nr:hypothetical protein [Glycomyces terrestris]
MASIGDVAAALRAALQVIDEAAQVIKAADEQLQDALIDLGVALGK